MNNFRGDFLGFYDGAGTNGTLLGHYCDTEPPVPVESSDRVMTIRFQESGDQRNKHRGFVISYEASEFFLLLFLWVI